MNKHRFLYIFFFLFTYSNGFAQISIKPLVKDLQRQDTYDKTLRSRTANAPTIDTLPFFDDFAGYSGQPNPFLWESEGGVLINNSYATNPPSINVATFDGLNQNGLPYNTSNVYARGLTDKLTSVPLNLSGYSPSDSLYISFFWQAGGLGENPDPSDGDFLRLDFKNSSNIWITVWQEQDISTPFTQHIMPILDTSYFHEKFQFRFQSYGSTAGSYDIWNLDYVFLSPGRTMADTNYADMAIQTSPGSILKNYSALPYRQFFNHLDAVVKDKLSFRVYNFSTPDELYLMDNPPEKLNKVTDALTGELFNEFVVQGFAFGKTHNTIEWTPDYSAIRDLDKPLVLKYYIDPEVTDSSIFKANNTVSDSTFLLNYMAYDDHRAEGTVEFADLDAGIAVRYTSLEPDSIIGVAIDFQPIGNNLTGFPVRINLWKSVTPGSPTEERIVSLLTGIAYSSQNSVARFYFDKPYRVDGTFYVGFEGEFVNETVHVGFDMNNDNSDKIVYKEDGFWVTHNALDKIEGSAIVRPIFGGSHYADMPIVGVRPEILPLQVLVYPNPTPNSDLISLKGPVRHVSIINSAGQEVYSETFTNQTEIKTLNLQHIPSGIYFMRLSGQKSYTTQKLILTD